MIDQDGEFLLTRSADLRQARLTSTLSDDQIHIWKDQAGADPTADLADLLAARGLAGKRLGIETDTQGLTAKWGMAMHRFPASRIYRLIDIPHYGFPASQIYGIRNPPHRSARLTPKWPEEGFSSPSFRNFPCCLTTGVAQPPSPSLFPPLTFDHHHKQAESLLLDKVAPTSLQTTR